MKKLLGLLITLAVTVSHGTAALLVVDFTNDPGSDDNTGAGISVAVTNPLFDNFDFGEGRTADITITTAGTGFSSIAVGLGATGGTENNRTGANEDFTIVFSDFQGGLTASDITFSGFVASTFASSGVFSIESGDVFDINGAALTADDTGDGAAADLTFGYDDYVYQNLDSGGTVALNGSNALVLDLTTDAGDGYRLQGVALEVAAVPEPSTFALLSLGLGAFVLLRRKRS